MNNTPNTVQNKVVNVGDIFLMSWGYDQTNVNFFQVTRVSPKGVFVREIGYRSAGGAGFMCQNVVAVKDSFKSSSQWCGGFQGANAELFRKLSYYNGNPCFSVRGRYSASLWDGKPTYESWYA